MVGKWFGKAEAIFYFKNGNYYTAIFHGSKEVGTGMELKIIKEMGLK